MTLKLRILALCVIAGLWAPTIGETSRVTQVATYYEQMALDVKTFGQDIIRFERVSHIDVHQTPDVKHQNDRYHIECNQNEYCELIVF